MHQSSTLYILVESCIFKRRQESTNLRIRFLAVRALFDTDKIQQDINTDEPDVLGVAGPTDLRLQFARVGASDHNQD
jgi:hypothetical protein